MADVPLTVAVIGYIATVVAGGIPVTVTAIRDSRRDKRARAAQEKADHERDERKRRRACVKLLRQGRDFRVLVENISAVRGTNLTGNAEQIRQAAADITGQADEVGFMVFATEASASALAIEARRLADTITDPNNMTHGQSLVSPNFSKFDDCLADFKKDAQKALGYQTAEDQARPGLAGGEPPTSPRELEG